MCAALLCCAFILPKTGNIGADAAVVPNDGQNKVVYTATDLKQWYNTATKSSQPTVPYSTLTAVNTAYGNAVFDSDTKTASLSKKNLGFHQLVGYIAFKAEIEVPAMTEYKIDFSYSLSYKRTANSTSSTTMLGVDIIYFGNTADDPSAQDQSASLILDGYNTPVTPSNYLLQRYFIHNSNSIQYANGTVPTITCTNNTNTPQSYTAFFGFNAGSSAGSTYNCSHWADLVMSDEITVTAIDTPTVDKTSVDYTGGDLNFTLQDWDRTRVALTKATYQTISGKTTTLYTYDNTADETVTGTNPVSASGVWTVQNAGTYTLYFDIYYWCGAVWDSSDSDQSTKTVTFKVEPKQIDKPTIAAGEKSYTGSAVTFALNTSLSAADWLKYIKMDSVTEAAGGSTASVSDKQDSTFEITDVGAYDIIFALKDTDNTVWSDTPATAGGTAKVSLKVTPKSLTTVLDCSSLNSGNWEWDSGTDNVEISVVVSGFVLPSDADKNDSKRVTLKYYYIDGDNEISLNGDIKSEEYDPTAKTVTAKILMPSTLGQGEYTFGVKPDGTSGANGNYTVNENSAKHSFTVKSASLDPSTLVWTYLKDNNASNETLAQNGKLSYSTNNGNAVTISPQVQLFVNNKYDYSNFVREDGYSGSTSASGVGTYATTVTLKITDTEHVFANPNSDANVTVSSDGLTATVRLNWEIEKREIDLSAVPFEYNDGINGWQPYNPENPPEKTGHNFTIRVTSADMPEGVIKADFIPGADQQGPGVMKFELEFELDDNHKAKDGKLTVGYSMTITGKQISANWVVTTLKDADGNEVKDGFNVPYYIYKLDVPETDPAYPFIRYEYYKVDPATGEPDLNAFITGGIDEIIKPTSEGGLGASSNSRVQVYVRAFLDGMTQINGVDPYELKFSDKQPEYKKVWVGENKTPVDLTAGTVTSITFGGSVNATDTYVLTNRKTSLALDTSFYKVSLYNKDETELIADEIRNGFDFSKLNAGDYKIVVTLTESVEESYILTSTNLSFKVNPVVLAVPTLKDGAELIFNGDTQQLEPMLDNFDSEYMEFAANSINEGRDAGNYKAVINIKAEYAGNYIFAMPAAVETPVKSALADEGAATDLPEVTDGGRTAAFKWSIGKYVIDTTVSGAWNFGKNGASLNLPNWLTALTTGAEPSLVMRTLYYNTEGKPLENVELKGGNKYIVAAYIDPACADAGNVEFKNQTVDPMTGLTTTPQTAYTVPKSGAAAFVGNVKDFVTKTWLGLPIWAWLAIGLAVLILLIIIIAVACKRRKSKEQRAEEKARKEEERRLQQERIEAERELARAKQEAELEKIRAQANMANAGMAATAMAMQQPAQQVQQPMPVPVQQPQTPVQQPVSVGTDYSVLAEIKAELAEIKARQNMGAQTGVQFSNDPVVAAELIRLKAENEAHMRAELERARSEAERARMETELARVRADSRYAYPAQQFEPAGTMRGGDMEKIGALAVAIWQSMNKAAEPAALKPAAETPQIAEESASSSAMYPPDAVITTTTTVDTTQKPLRRERENSDVSRFSDLDGFYDAYIEK